jgi:uncharacterized membrane protein
MDIRPYTFPQDGFPRGDGMPFRGALVEHADGGGGPGALTWAIFALLLLLLLLAIASLAIDAYNRNRARQSAPETASDAPPPPVDSSGALAVLDDRYARGEISRDEYLRTRDDLRGATDATTQVIPPEPEPA